MLRLRESSASISSRAARKGRRAHPNPESKCRTPPCLDGSYTGRCLHGIHTFREQSYEISFLKRVFEMGVVTGFQGRSALPLQYSLPGAFFCCKLQGCFCFFFREISTSKCPVCTWAKKVGPSSLKKGGVVSGRPKPLDPGA